MNMNDTVKMQLFEKLRSKGIPFEEKQIKKNGVVKTGLMIGNGIKRPRVLEHICERIGTGQLIIYPSSVYEILVTPYTDDLAHIATEIVPEINNTMVAAEDQLSDLPYLFDSATQKLTLLEEVTEYE